MTRANTLAVLAALAVLPGVAKAAPGFATPAEAFRAGVGICDRSYEGLKTQKAFGSELTKADRFSETPEAAQAPGVASVSQTLEHRVIAKAALTDEAAGAVYVISGAGPGGLPMCRVVAVNAPGAGAAAKAWFEDKSSGWSPKTDEDRDASVNMLSRVYGRPFLGDTGVGATLSYVSGEAKGAITALSSFSLAKDR